MFSKALEFYSRKLHMVCSSNWLAQRTLLPDLMTQAVSCYRRTSDGTIIGDDDYDENKTTLMADQYLLATLGHHTMQAGSVGQQRII